MQEINESQQASQGINIGKQGNQEGTVPGGMKGAHHKQDTRDDKHIPNLGWVVSKERAKERTVEFLVDK